MDISSNLPHLKPQNLLKNDIEVLFHSLHSGYKLAFEILSQFAITIICLMMHYL